MINRRLEFVLLALILAIGIFFRLWRLDSLPNGIDEDVVVSASNSLHIFRGEVFKYFQNNQIIGKPVAYLFWSAPLGALLIGSSLQIFRDAQFAVLFSTASIGILTIIAFYLLAREITDSARALLSTFFLAVSPWHVIFSRSGFAHIAPIVLFVCLSLYLTFVALKENKMRWYLILGLVWGVMFFNVYPIPLVVMPVTFVYLLVTKNIDRKKSSLFMLSLFVGVVTFLSFSIGFARMNHSDDPLIVLEDGYYQNVVVRLSETHEKTSLLGNVIGGLKMLFVTAPGTYQFGVFRIFGRPLLDPIISLTFVIGLLVSIVRRNKSDILLIIWFLLAFILSSSFTLPQERYFLAVMPVFYILSSNSITFFFRLRSARACLHNKVIILPLFALLLLAYAYFFGFRPYFVIYARNNANLTNGLAESDVARYAKENLNPQSTLFFTSLGLSSFNFYTKDIYKYQYVWKDFLKKYLDDSSNLAKTARVIEETPYEGHVAEMVKDGDTNTYWYGKVPDGFDMVWEKPQKINEIVIFFDSVGGRENLAYEVQSFDEAAGLWKIVKMRKSKTPVYGEKITGLKIATRKLRFSFTKANISDSVQKVEEVAVFSDDDWRRRLLFNLKGIYNIAFIVAMNPNFNYSHSDSNYYGNYNVEADIMNRQAETLFPGYSLSSKIVISGEFGRPVFKIVDLEIDNKGQL